MQAVRTILRIAKSVSRFTALTQRARALFATVSGGQGPRLLQEVSPCVVGIEACASSHYWSRELQALGTRFD